MYNLYDVPMYVARTLMGSPDSCVSVMAPATQAAELAWRGHKLAPSEADVLVLNAGTAICDVLRRWSKSSCNQRLKQYTDSQRQVILQCLATANENSQDHAQRTSSRHSGRWCWPYNMTRHMRGLIPSRASPPSFQQRAGSNFPCSGKDRQDHITSDDVARVSRGFQNHQPLPGQGLYTHRVHSFALAQLISLNPASRKAG